MRRDERRDRSRQVVPDEAMPKVAAQQRLAHVLGDRSATFEQRLHDRTSRVLVAVAAQFDSERERRFSVLRVQQEPMLLGSHSDVIRITRSRPPPPLLRSVM